MKIREVRLIPFRLAFRTPVATAGSVYRGRDGTLLRLETDTGAVGWGEASPLERFGTESSALCLAALERLAGGLPGRELEDCEAWLAEVAEHSPMAFAAAECALLDLRARVRKLSQWQLLCSADPEDVALTASIPVNALVLGDAIEDLVAYALVRRREGFTSFKLKVAAGQLDRDVDRVAALRHALGPDVKIRLDANQGWSEAEARVAVDRLASFEIEYLEQPVVAHDLSALARLREKSPIPIAADEAAISETSAQAVIEAEAADIIIIKPSAAGGAGASMRIARAAWAKKMRVVVTSLLDSIVATTAAAHVAAALLHEAGVAERMPACGLATGDLFVRDLADGRKIYDGALRLPSSIGLGVEPDLARIANTAEA